MALDYADSIYSAFRNALNDGGWSDCVANGVWGREEIVRVKIDDRTLPVAVLDVSPLRAAEWGLRNHVFESTVSIYRIDFRIQPSGVILDGGRFQRDRLEQLRDYFHANDALDHGQVTRVTAVRWDVGLPPNEYFAATQQSLIAGMLEVTYICGEQAE